MREQFLEWVDDPLIAHEVFFGSHHANVDAPFHAEMMRDWHSSTPSILTMAFRGSAKSTKAEEAITLEVCFRRVRNVLILGESETRAVERLAAIKHHFEYDEDLGLVFDVGPGDPWTETRACTSTGVMIQAYGRGQSLRGVKHLDFRPDFIFLDDVEDKESGSVATPEARAKTRSWMAGTVIPTLAPGGRMRMAATPLHPEALAPTLAKAAASWKTRTYPLVYRSPGLEPGSPPAWTSAWPDRFPLDTILAMKQAFDEIGESETFSQEYLCEARDLATQTFLPSMFRTDTTLERSWHAVYAIYDPARTTHVKSATTGKCVASWMGNRLVVWEASARKWMPDEIVNDIFATNEKYSPVAIGVEETGLNEWLLQPLRTRQVEAGVVLPLRSLRPPRGKLDFIRGLQSYFASGSVVFATSMPELEAQLVGFPGGAIDAPNALAYMLHMKLGIPIFDDFTDAHVVADVRPLLDAASPPALLVNTDGVVTTGVAAQVQHGRLVVLADALLDGDAGTVLGDLLRMLATSLSSSAQHLPTSPRGDAPTPMEARPVPPYGPRLVASSRHFDEYTTYGLRAAARALGFELQRGGETDKGREEIRSLLRRLAHGTPAFAVSSDAAWTSKAFAGGYARDAGQHQPLPNAYAVLIEPLEAFASTMRLTPDDALATQPVYAYTRDGRRYVSAFPDASRGLNDRGRHGRHAR